MTMVDRVGPMWKKGSWSKIQREFRDLGRKDRDAYAIRSRYSDIKKRKMEDKIREGPFYKPPRSYNADKLTKTARKYGGDDEDGSGGGMTGYNPVEAS